MSNSMLVSPISNSVSSVSTKQFKHTGASDFSLYFSNCTSRDGRTPNHSEVSVQLYAQQCILILHDETQIILPQSITNPATVKSFNIAHNRH